jgi:DNA invertase Pin-like site-specific DNA recombinase
MRAFAYYRVSGKGQVDGDGEARQREAVEAFCKAHSLCLHEARFEAGLSGTVEALDRPELAAILDAAQPGDALIVERMDRLARDLMVQEVLLAECRKRGLAVFPADQGALQDIARNDIDPTRKLIRQILGALAEWEKSALVKKLRASRERVKREKGRCEGNKPFGYYPGERTTLDALKSFIANGYTAKETAQALNGAGFRNRKGGEWSRAHVEFLAKGRGITKKPKEQDARQPCGPHGPDERSGEGQGTGEGKSGA